MASPARLRHNAFVYSSTDDYVSRAVGFVRDGLAAGEGAIVVARAFLGDRLRLVLRRTGPADGTPELVAHVPTAGAPMIDTEVAVTLTARSPLVLP